MPGPIPKHFGVALYPFFEVLDVFGPLEALNTFCRDFYGPDHANFTLSMISHTMDPVESMPGNPFNQSIVPTHTYATAPPLDVLIVPGGMGWEAGGTQEIVDFIRERFPSLQYLFTVCTGSDLAARAGVLDGKKATTNKVAWTMITEKETSKKTDWVAKARWVSDGNIWTTSGVSAGTDGMLALIKSIWGDETRTRIVQSMEYEGTDDQSNDPFAAIFGAKDTPAEK